MKASFSGRDIYSTSPRKRGISEGKLVLQGERYTARARASGVLQKESLFFREKDNSTSPHKWGIADFTLKKVA